ncbi:MAG: hypothetical protein ABIN99_10405 [Nitrosospira sp.]
MTILCISLVRMFLVFIPLFVFNRAPLEEKNDVALHYQWRPGNQLSASNPLAARSILRQLDHQAQTMFGIT